jgi:hypothetical protein
MVDLRNHPSITTLQNTNNATTLQGVPLPVGFVRLLQADRHRNELQPSEQIRF